MATIGLDKLYFAPITENATGEETYGTPVQLAKAISADLSVELAEATLYADDGAAEVIKEFKSGTLSLGIDDIGAEKAAILIGASVDSNGVLVSATEDGGSPVAIGFRAKKANGKYKYFWLYRVKFGVPATNLATKGDSISFNTPTIEGTVLSRNKPDASGKHPWKAEVTEGEPGVSATVISNWYQSVYEPQPGANTNLASLSIGSVALNPTFSAGTTTYTAATSNVTNTVSAAAAGPNATAVIKVNGTTHTSGQSATWNSGANTVVVTVTNGSATKTYTVTVTKS